MARPGAKNEPASPAAPARPVLAGDVAPVCGNCQHYDPEPGRPRHGVCHNGISGKGAGMGFRTRAIDGCGHGFYPSVERFPLKAGPGGAR